VGKKTATGKQKKTTLQKRTTGGERNPGLGKGRRNIKQNSSNSKRGTVQPRTQRQGAQKGKEPEIRKRRQRVSTEIEKKSERN